LAGHQNHAEMMGDRQIEQPQKDQFMKYSSTVS
jgi:hypothetical protein